MPLPTQTSEQLAAMREKGQAVRRLRAEMKKDLKNGRLTLEDVLEGDHDVAQKMYIRDLLASLPNIGKAKAAQIMADLDIKNNRRVKGLGVRQQQELLQRFGFNLEN